MAVKMERERMNAIVARFSVMTVFVGWHEWPVKNLASAEPNGSSLGDLRHISLILE